MPSCVPQLQETTDLRVLSRAYMEMLRDLSPPLNAGSRWSATRERIRDDPRFKVGDPENDDVQLGSVLLLNQRCQVGAVRGLQAW